MQIPTARWFDTLAMAPDGQNGKQLELEEIMAEHPSPRAAKPARCLRTFLGCCSLWQQQVRNISLGGFDFVEFIFKNLDGLFQATCENFTTPFAACAWTVLTNWSWRRVWPGNSLGCLHIRFGACRCCWALATMSLHRRLRGKATTKTWPAKSRKTPGSESPQVLQELQDEQRYPGLQDKVQD